MMKKLISILILFFSLVVNAQQFNNEWIDYNKTYYKFKIKDSGLYRIPQSVLAANFSATDVSQFQLWRNGIEVPIYTSNQTGSLAAGGYIEFWGVGNDGKPDLPLYRSATEQLNDSRSLYSDSAVYFLTVNPGEPNRRLIPVSNNIPTGVGAEPYFIYTASTNFNEAIHAGLPNGSGSDALYTASIEQGEGWASGDIGNGTRSFSLTNLFPYTGSGAPAVQVKMNAVGNAPTNRTIQLTLNNNVVFDEALNLYDYKMLSKVLPVTVLTGSTENFSITNTSALGNSRLRVAKIDVTYPRIFNFGGANNFRFQMPSGTISRYLEISGFTYSNGAPVLYDLANGRRYVADITNPSLLKFYLQPSAAQDLVLASQATANIKTITNLEPRNFINYQQAANQGNYLIISHNAILNGINGAQPVEQYRAYRSSAAGGGYNAKVYMIDQLTDQFGFGIKGSPLGVRNFIRWARAKYSAPIRHVFIAAKGVKYTSARFNDGAGTDALNLVPTFGDPGSDVLLAAEGGSSVPLVSIGRVPVINGNELAIYLEKVIQYEAQLTNVSPLVSQTAWKKNVAHMVGANDQPTIDYLYFLLNQQKPIITDTLYGANVADFVKSSSSGTQQNNTIRLAALINGGLSFLNYFGHSASNVLGFNLDEPSSYTNQGKYPVFNMMGCSVGDIFILDGLRFSGYPTISEKYVFAKERGAIAMMAGTAVGYTNTLDTYNREFYKLMSRGMYGASLGELMRQTIINTFQVVGGEYDQLQRSQCEEFTLNGDPALHLYQPAKPDYAIEDPLVTVNPNFISIAETSFKVNAKMLNLGKAIDRDIIIELKRTYPNLSTEVLKRDTIKGIRYSDSLTYTIPINPVNDKGQNKITITIDPDNRVDELFETNNSVTKDIFIFEDELRPVYPVNYAIVNKSPVKFAASTADPLAPSRNYIFEVDTTKLFNSSLKLTQNKTSTGGLIEFTPTLTLRDSTVYYWRVASAPASQTEQPKWSNASFIYINGADTGFNQSHYFQMLDNGYDGVDLSENRSYSFSRFNTSIRVTSAIGNYYTGPSNYELAIGDGTPAQVGFIGPIINMANSLRFYIVNDKTLKPFRNVDLGTSGLYGSYRPIPFNTSTPDLFHFDISTTAARQNVMKFIDSIPNGYYIAVTNSILASASPGGTILSPVWLADTAILGPGNSLYDKFLELGMTRVVDANVYRPFIFISQKGNPVALQQVVAVNQNDKISATALVKGYGNTGYIESPTMGPAKQWKKLLWSGSNVENPDGDNPTLDLIGIKNDGSEQVLLSGLTTAQQNVDISTIDAQQYPFAKLRMRNVDSTNYTPYQLKYWRLYYTPVPEGAIAPNLYFTGKDTLEVGEPLNFSVVFKNISDYKFDSLTVKMTIRNRNNVQNIFNIPKQKQLIAGDTLKVQVPVNTVDYMGNNQLFLEFNPNNDQPEQYHFNNFLYKNFYVRSDTLNPYMDVTFDGVHILNKDIVSSKPNILIKLTDQAKYLLLNNPDLVKIQLRHPDGSVRDYAFNSDTLTLTPPGQGTNDPNTATVNFKPHLLADGVYELIVSGKDQSGNTAGNLQYRIAFQVFNKPMISNLLNYPNPFTTSTAFVFTLTGSQLPQNIRIQILTITGKIVKEITMAELGPLKIGRNITEYKWDGTDQYGQKLANGVYLYRVITNLNGKRLDRFAQSDDITDKYFNKGYGKMYLMR